MKYEYSTADIANLANVCLNTVRTRTSALAKNINVDKYRKNVGSANKPIYKYTKQFLKLIVTPNSKTRNKKTEQSASFIKQDTVSYPVSLELSLELTRGIDDNTLTSEILPALLNKHFKMTRKMILAELK
jgi:hypothetical protein